MSEKKSEKEPELDKRYVKIRSISLDPLVDDKLNEVMEQKSKKHGRRIGRSELVNKILGHYLF